MKRTLLTIAATAAICLPCFVAPTRAADDHPAKDRAEAVDQAQKASKIFDEIMGVDEKSIPRDLLDGAEVIAVFPDVVKAAFIFGGSGGKGVVSARDPKTGKWGPPLFLKIGGGSWGAQIGAESADFVMVGLNRDSEKVFEQEEWTVSGEAEVAAGPVGRSAKAGTDWKANSGWVSYSRSKGLFAGLSLGGSKIKLDDDVNRAVYGGSFAPRAVLMNQVKAETDVKDVWIFPQTLAKYGAPKPD